MCAAQVPNSIQALGAFSIKEYGSAGVSKLVDGQRFRRGCRGMKWKWRPHLVGGQQSASVKNLQESG